jgi:hypothetical protein
VGLVPIGGVWLPLAGLPRFIIGFTTASYGGSPFLITSITGTTNGLPRDVTPILKMLKRNSHDIRNTEIYWIKMLLGFAQSHSYFHLNIKNCYLLLDKIEKTV